MSAVRWMFVCLSVLMTVTEVSATSVGINQVSNNSRVVAQFP
jgi:hypothetical protein